MNHDLGELPSPGMSVFDFCPRGQEQWLEGLLRDYGKKVREHDAAKKGSWEQVLGHLGTPDEVGNMIYRLKELDK